MNFKTKENKLCSKFKQKNRNKSIYTDKLWLNGRYLYKKIKMKNKDQQKNIIMTNIKKFKQKLSQYKMNIQKSKHKRNPKK